MSFEDVSRGVANIPREQELSVSAPHDLDACVGKEIMWLEKHEIEIRSQEGVVTYVDDVARIVPDATAVQRDGTFVSLMCAFCHVVTIL